VALRSEVAERAAFERIRYAQAWEDPRSDIEGLRIGPGDDVLAVGASGDNALAFVAAGARSVVAIDFNPSQNHLLELKVGAIESLEAEDVQAFLGAREAPVERRDFFYRTVRPVLSEPARAFWDAHPGLLRAGVIHTGKFERYLQLFHRWLLPRIHSRRTVRRLFELSSPAEQEAFYREVWDTWRWRLLLRIFFGRFLLGRLGRDPAFFEYVEVDSVGDAFRARAEHALTEIPTADNWFLEYMVLGRYADPEKRLPPYLRPEHHALLRERARERIRLEEGSFEDYLPGQAEGAFSCFYLSDIFEWMSEEAFVRLLEEFWRVGRHGGRLAYRNLLVEREHPRALDGKLVHERDRSRELHFRDRSFVYRNFVVERIVKDSAEEAGESGGAAA